MRVRAFTNRGSTKKVIGKFPSYKTGKTVWWESQLERDLIFLLEYDPDVLSYREQPLQIIYSLEGKRHIYTPDFLVDHRSEGLILEVKYEEEAKKAENVRLFQAVNPVCEEAGYRFTVLTEREIRLQPRLDTIKLLTRYIRTPIEPQDIAICHELTRQGKRTLLADAFAFFAERGVARATVYALIYRGELRIDLMQPLNSSSAVSAPGTVLRKARILWL